MRKYLLLALLVGSAWPALTQASAMQSSPKPQAEQTQSKPDDSATKPQPPLQNNAVHAVDQERSGSDAGGNSNAEGKGGASSHNWDEWVAAGTVALVIVTALLAAATLGLATSTKGLYAETKRLADQAVKQGEDTQRALAIAEGTAASTAVSAKSTRAWLTYNTTNYINMTHNWVNGVYHERLIGLQTVLINSGQSPALNVSTEQQLIMVARNAPFPEFNPTPLNGQSGKAILGIGQSNYTIYPIMGDDMAAFEDRTMQALLMTFVQYTDVFGDVHLTTFGLRIGRAGDQHMSDGSAVPSLEVRADGIQNNLT